MAAGKPRGARGLLPALLASILVLSALVPSIARAPNADASPSLPVGFDDPVVYSGLTQPSAIAFAPNGKVYVAEKRGIIKVYASTSSPTATVFADIRANVYDVADRGLLGLTVDPRLGDGSGHDFVYVLYARDAKVSPASGVWNDNCPSPPGIDTDGCVVKGRLSRIPVNPDGTSGPEQPLIDNEWCQQFSSHSQGHLAFGPDGFLYVTSGEGASFLNADWGQFGGSLPSTPTPVNPCGDPPGSVGVANTGLNARGGALRAQSPRRPAGEPRLLNGTLDRVNPDTGAGVPGNPMFNASSPSSNASRIVAHGFRNPYRFTVRPGTGEIWVADVGWGDAEEINRFPSPSATPVTNFGWPCWEGTLHTNSYRDLDLCTALYTDTVNPAKAPYYSYLHHATAGASDTCSTANGAAISGISFYDGLAYPAAYQKALFFADYARGCMWVMNAGSNGLPDPSTVHTFIDDADGRVPVDLEADPVSGDIFYVDVVEGAVHRIVYTVANHPPVARATAAPTSGTTPLLVHLDGTTSSDPDNDPITYSWDLNGDGGFGDATTATVDHSYTNGGEFGIRLRVTDSHGSAAVSAPITITTTSPTGPIATTLPRITGVPLPGNVVTGNVGTWSGPASTFQPQWRRCTGGDYRSAVLGSTPSAYWRLGETGGSTAVDGSGAGLGLTYQGGVALGRDGAVAGDTDKAIALDGADDSLLRNPFTAFASGALTVETFVRSTDSTRNSGLVSYAVPGSANEVLLSGPGNLRVSVDGTEVATGVQLADGAWHHLAVTWRSSNGALSVYKDGALAFSGTLAQGKSIGAGGAVVLGQDQDGVGGGFDPAQAFLGRLDEVALYRTALSADTIAAHARVATAASCSNISGATQTTYLVQAGDVGSTLRLHVTATNSSGSNTADSNATGVVPVVTGNQPPVPVIDTPAPSVTWASGTTVSFSGHATDAEDGTEPAARLSWTIRIAHCTETGCHDHFLSPQPGTASGSVVMPDHETPSHLQIQLTATDANGATSSTAIQLEPRGTNVTLQSSPTGVPLTAGTQAATPAPFTQTWVSGSQVQISAPTSFVKNGLTYTFVGWSDGGARTHTVLAATGTTTATYRPPNGGGGLVLDPFGKLTRVTVGGLRAPKAIGGPKWPGFPIARNVARLPNGSGGYVLDGYGGLHWFSLGTTAPAKATRGGPSWPGWDIARGVALLPSGTGGYVLDGYGGLHPFGVGTTTTLPATSGTPSWPGWDIARGLALLPDRTGGYVLDGYGGLHPFGLSGHAAPPVPTGSPYWPGWDIARSVSILPDSTGGYVQDGYGGLHPFSLPGQPKPPAVPDAPYTAGQDLARGVGL